MSLSFLNSTNVFIEETLGKRFIARFLLLFFLNPSFTHLLAPLFVLQKAFNSQMVRVLSSHPQPSSKL